jgi:hypothetical protein
MPTYLYRAVAAEPWEGESVDLSIWPGEPLGRSSGYLSRSAAVDAGERSGVKYAVVRSAPVVFRMPAEVLKQREIADLRDRLAMLTEPLAVTP